MRAIFGEKAGDVRDASLKAPPGMEGVVIDRKVFSRKERSEASRKKEKSEIAELRAEADNKNQQLVQERDNQFLELLKGKKLGRLRSKEDDNLVVREGTQLTDRLLERLDLAAITPEENWTDDEELNEKIEVLQIGRASWRERG